MEKPDLVFLTPDNDSKVRAKLHPSVRARIEAEEKITKQREAKFIEATEKIKQDAENQMKTTESVK